MPYLLYKNVGKALDWLAKAFGFVEFADRFEGKDGTIHHAAMQVSRGGEIFMMGRPGPKYKNPKMLRATTQMLYIYVKNVDQHFTRAKRSGAKILRQPEDRFYGDRSYAASDPEGHQWHFAQRVRNVSIEEMKRAVKKR